MNVIEKLGSARFAACEDAMRYEVEMKFPVAEMAALEARLMGLGATIAAPQSEVDVYFAHPARDFGKTDEALRIRRKGAANFITYKGPKIDAATKTRHEIDLPLPPGEDTSQAWTGMLEALGFVAAGEVRKSRRKAQVDWQGRSVEASLDQVERLGTFAELELVVGTEDVETAKACIASLANALGLETGERKSYLEVMADLIGCVERPRDLSSNPKYMERYGE
jgi:adenylate cyclase, class 2